MTQPGVSSFCPSSISRELSFTKEKSLASGKCPKEPLKEDSVAGLERRPVPMVPRSQIQDRHGIGYKPPRTIHRSNTRRQSNDAGGSRGLTVVVTLHHLLEVDNDLKDWLQLTNYHDVELRNKTLQRCRGLTRLDAEKARLPAEVEQKEKSPAFASTLATSTPSTEARLPSVSRVLPEKPEAFRSLPTTSVMVTPVNVTEDTRKRSHGEFSDEWEHTLSQQSGHFDLSPPPTKTKKHGRTLWDQSVLTSIENTPRQSTTSFNRRDSTARTPRDTADHGDIQRSTSWGGIEDDEEDWTRQSSRFRRHSDRRHPRDEKRNEDRHHSDRRRSRDGRRDDDRQVRHGLVDKENYQGKNFNPKYMDRFTAAAAAEQSSISAHNQRELYERRSRSPTSRDPRRLTPNRSPTDIDFGRSGGQ
jgi:hypothetical protein